MFSNIIWQVECVIISQLLSNMRKQVNRLSNFGFTATYIGKKDCNIDDVTRGYYQFVFGSPEILVGTDEWRGIFRHPEFSPRHKLTIIDESDAVYQWYCKNYTYKLCYLKSLTYRYLFLCSKNKIRYWPKYAAFLNPVKLN